MTERTRKINQMFSHNESPCAVSKPYEARGTRSQTVNKKINNEFIGHNQYQISTVHPNNSGCLNEESMRNARNTSEPIASLPAPKGETLGIDDTAKRSSPKRKKDGKTHFALSSKRFDSDQARPSDDLRRW